MVVVSLRRLVEVAVVGGAALLGTVVAESFVDVVLVQMDSKLYINHNLSYNDINVVLYDFYLIQALSICM